MILDYEIPEGCKLYFGEVAKYKRTIEIAALKVFYTYGLEEIATPIFSYLKSDKNDTLKISNDKNHMLSIRFDNTLDVVKILTKRVGKSTDNKRWFYIQPIFLHPSLEHYQAGIECIDEYNIEFILNIAIEFCKEINISPILLISNINIPLLISEELNISLDVFKNANIELLLSTSYVWLEKLVYANNRDDIKELIDIVPNFLKDELQKLLEQTANIKYQNTIYSPLYYSQLDYYNGIYFKFFEQNKILIAGGKYNIDDISGSGFAIYIDHLIDIYCK